MSTVEFHSIETRRLCASGRPSKGFYHLSNSLQRHGLAGLTQNNTGYGRRRLGNSACRSLKGLAAGMMQLQRSLGPIAMQGLRDARQSWNKRIVPGADLIGETLAARIDRTYLGNDQTGTSLSPSGKIRHQTVADRAVGIAIPRAHGRHDRSVFQGHTVNGNRCK